MCYNIDMNKLGRPVVEKKRRERCKEYYDMVKSHSSCMCCGSKDRIQFHHVNPNSKRFEVSQGVNYSLESLKQEMRKCWVMCEGCHLKLHRNLLCVFSQFYDGY